MGKAKNLKKRVSSYFLNSNKLGEKTSLLVNNIEYIRTFKAHSEIEALLLEANYIKKFQPLYNSRLTDGKAYPLIRITVKDDFPKVLQARRPDDKKSLYFGPYPNAGAMRLVLKTVRRIFPFQSVPNHPKKICLYNHLGLCPCPPILNSTEDKREYRKNIRYLIKFLNGKSEKVLKELKKERDVESKSENYEKASKIQRKIDSIYLITNPSYKFFDESFNPNLNEDNLRKESNEIGKYLNTSWQNQILRRIECYDISNIQGKYAVGSMTVFIDGEKDISFYRRFKIRYTKETPNDYAMMSEIIKRRIKHEEWPYPDLIVVDGGKGQVSTVKKILEKKNLDIPLIGLAKREEIIITSELKEIRLPRDSSALFLLIRIRDEAHRFAISYHRKLRSKALRDD